jgi:hypothetical protein
VEDISSRFSLPRVNSNSAISGEPNNPNGEIYVRPVNGAAAMDLLKMADTAGMRLSQACQDCRRLAQVASPRSFRVARLRVSDEGARLVNCAMA